MAGLDALMASLGSEHRRTQSAIRALVDLYEEWGKPEAAASYSARLAAPSQ